MEAAVTLSQALEVSAFGVLLGALLATIGWAFSRATGRSEARAKQDALDTVALSQATRDVAELLSRVDKVERRVAGHGEELSALGAVMDRHERWHDRHDTGFPPSGPAPH